MSRLTVKKEILAGNHKLSLGDDNIIYVNPSGSVSSADALKIKDAFTELIDLVQGDVSVLADLNSAGKPSIQARKVANEIFQKNKIKKLAFVGINSVAKVIAKFMLNFLKKKEARFFESKKDALDWLLD